MYTKEDAETHQKIMKAIRKDVKRPQTWADLNKIKDKVNSLSVKVFDQAAQNMQSEWEQIVVNALYVIEYPLVLIVNNGVTKRLKKTATQALIRLTRVLDDLIRSRADVHKAKKEFILSKYQQRQLIRKIKKIFDSKIQPKRSAR